MTHRQKQRTAKAKRESFFLARSASKKTREAGSPIQDGSGNRSREGSLSPAASTGSLAEEQPLTATSMRLMLSELADTFQANMKKQLQGLAAEMRKDIAEIGQRTAQVEQKLDECVDAHNCLADKVQALAPETQPDQLVVGRVHRLRRPQHLPPTAERDVIARIHFFHVKERIVKASRMADMPNPYGHIKIFADLSAETALREKNIAYRWGYPAKLLIHWEGKMHVITNAEKGLNQLKDWGIQISGVLKQHPTTTTRVTRDWSTT
ncbi:Hypothetical predicted protein [Pelobates cultripes]|uniref:Transposase n=1 Tax=Pelobates cultripes TaxID=61616 RepID=A0AAD1WUQ5_PELCU|nr:Hypothetical predicted protein [Pelobates cultripes]